MTQGQRARTKNEALRLNRLDVTVEEADAVYQVLKWALHSSYEFGESQEKVERIKRAMEEIAYG